MSTKFNIVIEQGTNFNIESTLEWSNGSIFVANGYIAEATIRSEFSANSSINFDTIVDENENKLYLSLTPEKTSNVKYGRYVYDVVLHNPSTNNTIRILEGIADITPQVTK
jgi:flavoprotein